MEAKKPLGYAGAALVGTMLVAAFFYFSSAKFARVPESDIRELGGGSRVVAFAANQRLLVAGRSPWLDVLNRRDSAPPRPPFGAASAPSTGEMSYLTICAEPSPDALSDITGESSIQARESLGEAKNKYATLGQNIGVRTPTVQVLRDSMYRLCEAFGAGGVSPSAYAMLLRQYQDVMVGMLAIENLSATLQQEKAEHGQRPAAESDGTVSSTSSASAASGRPRPSMKEQRRQHLEPTEGVAAISNAVAKIVETIVSHDRRADYCLALLSYPATPLDVRNNASGEPEILWNPSDDANRAACRSYLFPP